MRRRDAPEIERILFDRERYCVGAAGRYLAAGSPRGWMFREGGALILDSHRSLFPLLCKDAGGDTGGDADVSAGVPFPPFMKRLIRSFSLHTVQGLRGDVEFLERGIAALGREPADRFDYDLMALDREPRAEAFGRAPPGLVLRRPAAADMEELFALQSAYEMEEVLPKGAVFNPAASRLNLARILAGGQILAAELGGRIVGKINASAVSFTRCQIGGVYVHPGCRAMGIGRRMTAEFTRGIIRQGRGISLFVKKRNTAARRVYLGIGFETIGDYRISYY
jgi:ribosomal protein S18 acetylase RimI-like enzyme